MELRSKKGKGVVCTETEWASKEESIPRSSLYWAKNWLNQTSCDPALVFPCNSESREGIRRHVRTERSKDFIRLLEVWKRVLCEGNITPGMSAHKLDNCKTKSVIDVVISSFIRWQNLKGWRSTGDTFNQLSTFRTVVSSSILN